MNSKLKINNYVLEKAWPNLTLENHDPKSDQTANYNCHAWAIDIQDDKWAPYETYTWFEGFEKLSSSFDGDDTRNYVKGYESIGYEECDNGNFEKGYEKIALYAVGKNIQHTAKQLDNGMWTSKLGDFEDIEHTLFALEDGDYGNVIIFMKRKKPN